ncbi:Tripartite motif-containing protein 3 [Geodia barretti]|uniref:Tripartite motif-containing protein 3 n=1 Tax=Geodia barretti TaxID=519541 RepID=A0AA35RYW9_GEOBA|nr:Tripartite motif-containing protein 3 [Geodia barretti]
MTNQVYVCDHDNHRIQVFDPDLNFVRSIGSCGKGRGEFNAPLDVKFDTAGNMYVAEYFNGRMQVMDTSGQFIRVFGQEGERKQREPSGLHITDKFSSGAGEKTEVEAGASSATATGTVSLVE